MRRPIQDSLTIIAGLLSCISLSAQSQIVESLNRYGTLDSWSVRQIKESGLIGGQTKYLYEFYGNRDTTATKEPFTAPEGYLWRTNNVMAVVAGITKTNNTVFPEPRDGGYCARIETHIETVKAIGIINMDVVCQGAFILGTLNEPIKDTKNPMAKVLYGVPFEGRPTALVFDYKADVGHEAIRGTGFSKLKNLGYPDYPEIAIILQKRWEDEEGNVHALRVGTGIERITENVPDWVDGHRIDVHYGDISSEPFFKDYMGLNNNPERAFHTLNGKGDNVIVSEEGWAAPEEQPNFMIIKFISSCGKAFYGGVGNTLWIDNIRIEM
ncbi:MAG: PCMD domain-containing protein [Bacteroidetes bacterium]|uniref:PCMD domain-containing protein n=1 Tax=Candidatus Cryptobacteroides faecipullorum TaxID=2840764 RepID=A0A9D9I6M8_9BACT|nr:PCMD domain-containing protein [Candidatus Cryptobacteroides faecipullorum]